MRQRSVKNKDVILENLKDYNAGDPSAHRGDWQSVFPHCQDVYLEIGSGKGRFIATLAKNNPQNNYLASEGGTNIALRILQKAEGLKLENLKVITEYVLDPEALFAPDELAGIYINFCDPWPKARHEKRRLTHRHLLQKYCSITKPDACLFFKTDNQALFEFTLCEISSLNLKILDISEDLHSTYGTAAPPDYPETEYEERFANQGKKIYYVKVLLMQAQDMENKL